MKTLITLVAAVRRGESACEIDTETQPKERVAEVNSESFRPKGEIFSAVKYKDFSVEDFFEMTFPELCNRPFSLCFII